MAEARQRRTWIVCPICGAVTRDDDVHMGWHDRVKVLLDRDLQVRWVSVELPQMLVGTLERDIVWHEDQGGPLPTDLYAITPTVHLPSAALLGRTEVSVKAGSRTRQGCTLLLGTSLLLPPGAVVEVVAVHFPLSASTPASPV